MTIFRRRARSRPIRLFLVGMLAVPLVSLLTLWGIAASITISAAVTNAESSSSTQATNAGVYLLLADLPQERQESYVWLLSGRQSGRPALLSARALVDKAVPLAKNAFLTAVSTEDTPARATVIAELNQIGATRKAVDSGAISPAAAFQAYSAMLDAEFHYFLASARDHSGTSMVAISIGAVDGAYSLEVASREVALIDGALAAGGQLTPAVRELFAASAQQRQQLLAETQVLVPPDLYPNWVNDSPAYRQFQAMEKQILASSGDRVPVGATAWRSATAAYLAGTQQTQSKNAPALAALTTAASNRQITEAALTSGIGLAAVAAAVFFLIWFGRKVTGDLTRLDSSVREMAEERLPRVVARLRQGEDVNVAAESPPPDVSSIREVSTIAQSFATVQEAAISATVDQARLRKGVNQVFLNISMRNQSLLFRQLKMLDSMERRTSDPAALAELFRLDHLTTRMRRHAEGLIILSGSAPGRGWRQPVPVVDVLRAAVAEVEDYVRVDMVSESREFITGTAVSDIIHLTAELVENAAVFSPPNTRIEVRGDRVGTGLVVEIEDRGLGLSAAERDAINYRLASPPEFDLANSDQLGLFIVSQLASRHRIMVSLRESAYGGTTAIMRLPFGVVVREGEEAPGANDGWVTPDGPPAEPKIPGTGPQRAQLAAAPAPHEAYAPQELAAAAPGPGGTGRHRLRTTATGRFDEGASTRPADQDNDPSPRNAPRAPWELDPQAAGTGQENWSPAGWSPGGNQSAAAGPPPPAGPPTATSPRPGSGNHLGMPVRVPQASIAPQLRGHPPVTPNRIAGPEHEVDDRAPEATRDMMTLMQQGWKLGRRDDIDAPDDTPRNGTDW